MSRPRMRGGFMDGGGYIWLFLIVIAVILIVSLGLGLGLGLKKTPSADPQPENTGGSTANINDLSCKITGVGPQSTDIAIPPTVAYVDVEPSNPDLYDKYNIWYDAQVYRLYSWSKTPQKAESVGKRIPLVNPPGGQHNIELIFDVIPGTRVTSVDFSVYITDYSGTIRGKPATTSIKYKYY